MEKIANALRKVSKHLQMRLLEPSQIKLRTKVLFTLFSLSLFSFVTVDSGAQVDSTLHVVKSLNLPTLKKGIEVFYSPGYEARASHIQSYMQDAMHFYKMNLNVNVEISIAVLTKSHWEQVNKFPFDVPNVSGQPHVVFLPANFGEGVMTAGWDKTKHLLKPVTIEKLKSAGYSYEEVGVKNIDFIGLHELGHTVAEKLEISFSLGKPNSWYNEFLATYLAYAYLIVMDPNFVEISVMLSDHQLETMPKQPYTSLEDFERLYFGVGPENYGWYQIKLGQLAEQIYDSKGLDFIKELRASKFSKNEKISVDVLLQNLEQIAPGFIAWSREL